MQSRSSHGVQRDDMISFCDIDGREDSFHFVTGDNVGRRLEYRHEIQRARKFRLHPSGANWGNDMASPFNLRFGGVNLTSGEQGDSAEMPPETPFRLLICGNLGGSRPNVRPLDQRKPIEIDRDNFDEVLAKMAPGVTLPAAANGADLTISFRELDDFEPDSLFKRLPVFDELRSLQDDVAKPSTFPQAAAKIRAWANVPEPVVAATPVAAPPREVSAVDLIQEVLAASGARASPELPGSGDWQRFLTSIVKPQLVEKSDPRQADYAAVVEEAIGAQMRAILHHPVYQALEAAWRSVFFLVKRLPTDETLKIFVLDVRLDEWRADLAHDDPSESVFVREVNGRAVDQPWAAFVSLETFGRQIADLEMLASMVALSARSRTPVLAAVDPTLFGCPSLATDPDPRTWKPDPILAAAWETIRGMAPARYLGAVATRFLLRLPCGKRAAKTESFDFEEIPTPNHDGYLWGSGAVACALLLAEGFVASGWKFDPDDVRQIDGLPVHVYDDEGESTMKPSLPAVNFGMPLIDSHTSIWT